MCVCVYCVFGNSFLFCLFPSFFLKKIFFEDVDDDDVQILEEVEHNAQDIVAEVERDERREYKRMKNDLLKREQAELNHQSTTCLNFIRSLNRMEEAIDEFLLANNRPDPSAEFVQYAEHNWCYRFLTPKHKSRLTSLRKIIEEWNVERERERERQFWLRATAAEEVARNSRPMCTICHYDLRNEMFKLLTLTCGHIYHERCVVQALEVNPKCPYCRFPQIPTNARKTFFSYE